MWWLIIVPKQVDTIKDVAVHFCIPVEKGFKEGNGGWKILVSFGSEFSDGGDGKFLWFLGQWALILGEHIGQRLSKSIWLCVLSRD